MPFHAWRFSRFLLAGGANTVLSYLVFLALVPLVPYRWAYTGSFAFGMALGYWMNARLVFRQNARVGTALQYVLAYGLNYLAGLTVVTALVEVAGVQVRVAPLAALLVTVPLSYAVLKFVFRSR